MVENIVCTLRNLSYKVDLEIDREAHPDAIKIEDKTDGERGDASPRTPSKSSRPLDASPSGCLFMKKKPPTERKKFKKMTLKRNEKPKAETLQYVRPERDHPPMGVELLWEPETVNLYIYLLDKCSNAVTLEAAAGAIHNLVACQWNVSCFSKMF